MEENSKSSAGSNPAQKRANSKPNPNKKPNANKKRNNRRNAPYNITQEMKLSIIANKKSQDSRMAPWRKIDPRNTNKIRFTPLGGLGEIGGNMAVFETQDSAIIIDVGMSFPDETMHGVDILVPDFSYIQTIKHKIKGIVITHAHEDHIGAMPYLFKRMKFPIYATPIALAMIENKFNEHGLKNDIEYFNFVTKREIYEIGEFKVEWIHATHSIIDACSLAIETPAGIVMHTADFKIDHTPIDGYTMDLNRFAHYGDRGVLCLFSDSTNSHNPGFTKSEAVVGKTFDLLFDKAKGRLFMSTFSSNMHRIYQAMERAIALGRKICVIGRSMERNIEITRALGYIDIPDKHFVDAHEVNRYKDSEILIITTGSQGESMAALSRMATDEHRHIKLKPTDTVIISASAIPGNEGSVSRLMNLLMKSGVTVRYKEFENIHVSGHAGQEEQKLILRLVQPKFFLPVHGEFNHISKHAQTAVDCGIQKRNILLMNDGDQVEISTKYLKKVKSVKTGKTYIDNQNNKTIENGVVIDRQKLASDGIVNIVAQISQADQNIVGQLVVTTFGLVPDKENKKFTKEIEQIVEQLLRNEKNETLKNHTMLENDIRVATKRHISRTKKRYPLIIPTIFIV
ncbi:Zn-dependent hydrolase, RNA-metabolising [hydrothermal vent metagenome]|uniref:Zn-dependent hydrolase, RNA-metabolising n=1 Tax=hydrothermal vent metagenome TaxID=652676 RepID=A0A1W1EHC7_9ZZZZ